MDVSEVWDESRVWVRCECVSVCVCVSEECVLLRVDEICAIDDGKSKKCGKKAFLCDLVALCTNVVMVLI